MSQPTAVNWGLHSTGPSRGSEVATRANATFDALLSSHSGGMEPAYRTTGTVWLDTASATAYKVKIRGTSDWRSGFEFDPSGPGVRIPELVSGTASAPAISFAGDPDTGIYRPTADQMGLTTGGVVRMAIDATGYVTVGKTNSSVGAAGISMTLIGNTGYAAFTKGVTGAKFPVEFYDRGTAVGSIAITDTSTSYNTSSDYRLKEIEGEVTDSGAFIDALHPCKGTWKIDGSPFVGFIAHEFQAVSPSSVSGTKDAEREVPIYDEEGNITGTQIVPDYQSMQASSPEVIANIIAELQSLRTRVAELEAR